MLARKFSSDGQNAMAAAMAREKGDLAALQFAEHERVRRLAERRLHALFVRLVNPGME